MKAPVIMYATSAGWREIPGHDCWTPDEADEYVATLDPSGSGMLVHLREGETLPPCPLVAK